eukprot:gene5273-5807_t
MATFEGKKDFTAEVKIALPHSVAIADSQGLEEALAYLLPLEKKCRVNNDFLNLKEVCLQMIRLCHAKQEWEKLNAVLALINKRSAQHKLTLTAVVQEALGYIDSTPSVDLKINLIKALKEVCEGKIHVEGESARLHFMLAKIYEDQGNIAIACDTIQDVHVETYGSLTKMEKAEYILEQVRLNLIRKDFIRTAIQSRKMNLKTIEEEGFEEIKIRFYIMQVEYHMYQKDAWEVCQAYYKVATTKLKDSIYEAVRKEAIESCIVFLLISKHDNHQSDMLHRLKALLTTDFRELALDAAFSHSIKLFTTNEIIDSPFPGQQVIESHGSVHKFSATNPEIAKHFVETFHVRLIEHNLRVIALYYKRIRLGRLQELLRLSADELEGHLSNLSFSGDLRLKIDRPAGIVTFQHNRQPEEVLSDWSADITKMLSLLESTCHLVNREIMVHKL